MAVTRQTHSIKPDATAQWDAGALREALSQTRQELAIRSGQLNALVDFPFCSVAFFTAEPPFTVLMHNAYYQRLWREPFRSQGLVGKHLLDYVPEAEASGVLAVFEDVVRTREPRNLLGFPYDGMERGRTWWNWHLSPILEGDQVVAIAHMAIDVTSEVEARREAERRAADAEEGKRTLEALLSYIPEGITIASAPDVATLNTSAYGDRLLTDGWNQTAGMSMEDWLGKVEHFLADGVTPARKEDLPLWKAVKLGETVEGQEMVLRRPNGDFMNVLCNAGPIRNDHILGGIVAWRDITARKRLEEALRQSERLYRTIGESIDYGVWVCDPEGRNTYASASFLNLVGLTQEQCSSYGWGAVLHPDDRERTLKAWSECVRAEGSWDIEHRFRGVDGQWHHVLARGLPVRDEGGRITCWAGINLDIDQLKRLEVRLKEEALRKDDFLALLGHELRNPLVPIRNAVHLIRKAGTDPSLLDKACTIVESQVAHIVRLVDDLLDVSRITRGKVQIKTEPIDLLEVVRSVLHDYRPVLAESSLELETSLVSGTVWIDADRSRMVQVVGNLLHNAIKFTDPGGRISVTAGVHGQEWGVVVVKDTGTGIPNDELEMIFRPFMQRQETIGRSRGGLGLGLALVKGLIELHGGTVTARSAGPGLGSEFTLRLPLARAAEPSGPLPPAAGAREGMRKRRILVVEDLLDAASTLKLLLELWGHAVAVAHDGRSGLEKAGSFAPDLILCDIGLPGDLDGFGVARAIRSTPGLERVHLIALTGFGSAEIKEQARAAGFDVHLTKPVEPASLEQMIASLVIDRPPACDTMGPSPNR